MSCFFSIKSRKTRWGARVLSLAVLVFPVFSNADCNHMIEVAVDFTNSYIAKRSGYMAFVQSSSLVSADFKLSYKKIIEDAFKENPDYGLGYDPVLNAQDSPDEFDFVSCDNKNNKVVLQGKHAESFVAEVYLIEKDGVWLVNKMGSINQ